MMRTKTSSTTLTACLKAGSSGPVKSGAPAGSREKVSLRPGIMWKNSVALKPSVST